MGSDLYSRILLAVVAGSLALLVAQGFGLGVARPEPPATADASYRVTLVGNSGMMLRFDQRTGSSWVMHFRSPTGPKLAWIPVPVEGEPALGHAADAPAP